MSLRIIATGGTFDKHYDPIDGKLTFDHSHLPEIVETARLYEAVELEIVVMIDSLEMGEEQRLSVLKACAEAPESRLVVVHGTDTMVETARLIGKADLEKCVVFTGAMVPYSVRNSDALFNLGGAIMASKLLEKGTWLAMNGRILSWREARKDRKRGVFISTSGKTRTEPSE